MWCSGLLCSKARESSWPRLNPCPLHWQAGSDHCTTREVLNFHTDIYTLFLFCHFAMDTWHAVISSVWSFSRSPWPPCSQFCVLESERYGEPGRIPLSSGFPLVWPLVFWASLVWGSPEEAGGTEWNLEKFLPGSVHMESPWADCRPLTQTQLHQQLSLSPRPPPCIPSDSGW